MKRVYVRVISEFDPAGYMMPRQITWSDGRTFPIDSIEDLRPASAMPPEINGACFIIRIRGKEKHLFYERPDHRLRTSFGRWFVETPDPA